MSINKLDHLIFVGFNGYAAALDREILWHNPMSGYGCGPAAMVLVRGQSDQSLLMQAATVDAQRRASNTSILRLEDTVALARSLH